MSEIVESDKLKQMISKIENIEIERQEISDLLKDAYLEAKSMGFDVKISKVIVVAIMRKLSHLVFGVLKNKSTFTSNFAID